MIRDDGWRDYSIWEHSTVVRDLYRGRARDDVDEMDAHAQAAELLAPRVRPGETVLDVGCGSGYFFHALRRRGLDVEYHGIDASPSLVEIGREELPRFGLPLERVRVLRIEDLAGEADHVVCVNVLSNLDNWHRPLERLLRVARRTVILRESLKEEAEYRYVRDAFVDPGVDLKVHVNAYPLADVLAACEEHGFAARAVIDRRTAGEPEIVIGYPHWWTFVVAERAR